MATSDTARQVVAASVTVEITAYSNNSSMIKPPLYRSGGGGGGGGGEETALSVSPPGLALVPNNLSLRVGMSLGHLSAGSRSWPGRRWGQ